MRSHTDRRHELLEKIAADTAKMRHHQKLYFRTRDKQAMQEAVRLEGIVDRHIQSLDQVNAYIRGERPGQAELF
jgi:hypothetical protein